MLSKRKGAFIALVVFSICQKFESLNAVCTVRLVVNANIINTDYTYGMCLTVHFFSGVHIRYTETEKERVQLSDEIRMVNQTNQLM